jgi:hypothetical protein
MAAAAEARGPDFPVGMKVLVVDDDPTCLVVLKRMLLECRYDGELTPRNPLSSLLASARFLWRASLCSGREMIDCFESVWNNMRLLLVSASMRFICLELETALRYAIDTPLP